MKTHKCEKDGKYIISTNSDCVVTDVETGIVLAVVLAKTQKVIQAISDSFTTSVECSVRPFVEATSDIDLFGGGEDYLPAGYKKLEYLESSGKQYIDTGIIMQDDVVISAKAIATAKSTSNYLFGLSDQKNKCILTTRQQNDTTFTAQIGNIGGDYTQYERYFIPIYVGDTLEVSTDGISSVTLNGVTQKSNKSTPWVSTAMDIPIFAMRGSYGGAGNINYGGSYKLYSFSIAYGDEKQRDFVPALDDTGTPCMYDKVSHQSYYNSGSGDFIIPPDEYDTQTLDLNDMVYGKMTEYGIRRLYKVPAGETMSRDDYAIVNGYKEIVEPPMPTEGYWVSQWKETDTQLILEWIETEAPTEEL